MNSLDSLISKLSPIGIYSITADSNIYKELCAYSVGLDIIRSELDTVLRECFFYTAETYGLERPERLWGAARKDLTTEKRREMLLTRSTFGYGDFTLDGMKKILSLLGIEGTVTEYPKLQSIAVDVSDGEYTNGQRAWIISQINALFPAHLEIDTVFSGITWTDIDKAALTFDEADSKKLTWKDIDLL